jgi:hypothetical protein
MFQQVASPEERLRIVKLEPFDEIEEWHLEGCHFALMVASKGGLTDWLLKFAGVSPRLINSAMVNCTNKPCVQWELVEPTSGHTVCRCAHETVNLGQEDCFEIFIIGGFGPSEKSLHGRRHEVLCVHNRYRIVSFYCLFKYDLTTFL